MGSETKDSEASRWILVERETLIATMTPPKDKPAPNSDIDQVRLPPPNHRDSIIARSHEASPPVPGQGIDGSQLQPAVRIHNHGEDEEKDLFLRFVRKIDDVLGIGQTGENSHGEWKREDRRRKHLRGIDGVEALDSYSVDPPAIELPEVSSSTSTSTHANNAADAESTK